MSVHPETASGTPLLERVCCPHCWHRFAPEDILWIAVANSLLGDPVLGPDAQLRFLPSRFTASGIAIDADGQVCQHMACPRCHLIVPLTLLTSEPTFASIVGAPGSGKSYLLASMTHTLRRRLPREAFLSFTDADVESNLALSDNERVLFHNPDQEAYVYLRKTETAGGDMYHNVTIDGVAQALPRPFIFNVAPLPRHAAHGDKPLPLVLYDNAGEHFAPGADTANSPVTRHIAHSRAVIYLFDPTKDTRFRARLKGDDPQITERKDIYRQDVMLNEIALRIRRLLNLGPDERHKQSLVIVVAKFDLWRDLLDMPLDRPPFAVDEQRHCGAMPGTMLESVSLAVRELLNDIAPEIIGGAEANWETVRYLPASATGCSPTLDPETGLMRLRPGDLHPVWAEASLSYLIGDWRPAWILPGHEPEGEDVERPVSVERKGHVLVVRLAGGETFETPADYAGLIVRCPRTKRRVDLRPANAT